MTVEGRVNIASTAKRFRQEGYIAHKGEDTFLDGATFFEKHKAIKQELYSLTAVIADEVVRDAYVQRSYRSPFGLMTLREPGDEHLIPLSEAKTGNFRVVTKSDIDSFYPFFSVSDFVRETLFMSMADICSQASARLTSPELTSVYTRLQHILRKLNPHFPYERANRFEGGAEGFLASGINFAAVTMTGLLDTIDKLAAAECTGVQEQQEIAKNSYPLVMKLASGEFERVVKAVNVLSTAYPGNHLMFDSTCFEIANKGNGRALEISLAGKLALEAEGLSLDGANSFEGTVVGCPATVNFGEGSAVSLLWDWHVEIKTALDILKHSNHKPIL